MSRLLVTGGAGFIGSHVVDLALASGWEVRVLDSFRTDVHPPGARAAAHTAAGGAELVVGDVTDPAAVEAALEGVDAVAHQAAKVGLGVDFNDAPDYAHSNVTGTAALLGGMARRGIRRLVLASSMVVYGEGLYEDAEGAPVRPTARRAADLEAGRFEPRGSDGASLAPRPIREDDALDPRNVYATTKLSQELLATSWARECGGTVAALRYHNVFGARMPHGSLYAGVASLFRTALERGQAPHVFEDGCQRRDFIDARDVASANLAAVAWTANQHPGTFRPFNIGSGRVHTVLEFAAALAAALDGPTPVVTGEFRLGDVRHITASAERAMRELEWAPGRDFAAAVAEFARAPLRESAAAKPR